MRKLEIYRKGLTQAELGDLRALLESSDTSAKNAKLIDDVPPPDEKCDDEIVIFLLTDAVLKQDELEVQIARVMNGGRRAICVWPKDAAEVALPSSVKNYSYSIVSWNPTSVRKALANDDVTCFETPAGEPVKPAETERLICKEDAE